MNTQDITSLEGIRILAIVVTYNGDDWVDYCFGSLVNSSYMPDIICIDNNSLDNTTTSISNKFPQVNIVPSGINLGFGKANNIGINKAIAENYDFILLLNQDARIEPNTIEKLVIAHNANKVYGVLSPIHRSFDNNRLDENFSNFLRESGTPDFLSDFILGNSKKEIYTTGFVNAAIWLVSSKCFRSVGLFDPIFPHYGEDDDYIDRVHRAGFLVGIVPAALANHARDYTSGNTNVKGIANFRSDTNREYVNLLLQFKKRSGSRSRKRLFFFRKMLSSIFEDALMLDFNRLRQHFICYTHLLKKSFDSRFL